jgi:hypothetical protein
MRQKLSDISLVFPVFKINPDFKNIIKYDRSEKLFIATKLAVVSRSSVGCYLLDSNNSFYVVSDIEVQGDLSPKKSLFNFIFRNPLQKIDLILEEENDIEVREKCKSLLKFVENRGAYSVDDEE